MKTQAGFELPIIIREGVTDVEVEYLEDPRVKWVQEYNRQSREYGDGRLATIPPLHQTRVEHVHGGRGWAFFFVACLLMVSIRLLIAML